MHEADTDRRYDDDAEDGLGIQDVLRVLRRHWLVILAVGILIASATAAVMWTMPNRYSATAQVQVEPRRQQITNIKAVIENVRADTPVVESEVEVLQSNELALAVIAKLNLRDDPEFNSAGPLQSLKAKVGLGAGAATGSASTPARTPPLPASETARGSVVEYLRSKADTATRPERDFVLASFRANLSAQRVRNSLLINVTFESTDPVKAARIVNTAVALYLEAQVEAKDGASALAVRLLDDRIAQMRTSLTEAEQKLERYRNANDLFDSDGRSILEKQLSQEVASLVTASNRTAEAEARYREAEQAALSGRSADIADILKDPTAASLHSAFAEAIRTKAQLETRYGPRHPAMQKANADVAKTRAQLVSHVNTVVANLKSELSVAKRREEQLRANLTVLKQRISASKDKTWKLEELSRDVKTSRELYESLMSRRKAMVQAVGLNFPDSTILQTASVPLTPDGPKRKRMVLLALIGGLGLAFAAAFAFEMLRPGFTGEGDAEKELMIDQIGALPAIADAARDPLRAVRHVIAEPHGPFTEAMRGLAFAVRTRAGVRPVVLVSSSLAAEDSTLTASNLATVLASMGLRTVLVDGDLRNGQLSRTLGIDAHPGLADVITGRALPSAATLHDTSTNLHVIPCGNALDGDWPPAELLASEPCEKLFAALRSHFDAVIIDGPALLPVADSRILATYTTSVLLVVRWRQTAKTFVKQAIKSLGFNERKIIGITMSGVAPEEYISAVGLDHWSARRTARAAPGYHNAAGETARPDPLYDHVAASSGTQAARTA
jgi:succinoglycan biosynthesis transport protein ExoP